MKWQIPAKTFLLGEYAALAGGPALLLTTEPCFAVNLTYAGNTDGVHVLSPAGVWWAKNAPENAGLSWHDPYHGRGGMGASSAQFLGVYLACQTVQKKELGHQHLLEAYLSCAWQGQGLPPSGYDVLAQSMQGCVYIHKQQGICESLPWVFADLSFVLLHTGKKLATHEHLQQSRRFLHVEELASIVCLAREAFACKDSGRLIDAVKQYHQQLAKFNLVSQHSLQLLQILNKYPQVAAAKGCGALGADVLLLLVPAEKLSSFCNVLQQDEWPILATSENLYTKSPLIENNPRKTLEISP
ncbi:mevalonate kinase family protein [Legionella septentrionalis]|uniref:mevalonate kinase family protein n=1 Tax=Legionella septentrionalis TaxID=2498109 RepID=UPI000F8DE9AE|nr:hypothetical protein [Legionella septentrionalis]RUQ96154.1 hypothetical protein ELY11_08440 [Legionella septentrionalis]